MVAFAFVAVAVLRIRKVLMFARTFSTLTRTRDKALLYSFSSWLYRKVQFLGAFCLIPDIQNQQRPETLMVEEVLVWKIKIMNRSRFRFGNMNNPPLSGYSNFYLQSMVFLLT